MLILQSNSIGWKVFFLYNYVSTYHITPPPSKKMTIGLPVITEKSKYTLHPENDNNRLCQKLHFVNI